jgi:hypothetical protein
MTKTEAIERLDALNLTVEGADLASLDKLTLADMTEVIQSVAMSPDLALAERQAKARIGYLERAIRSNGDLPSTNDIEKLRRRAARAVVALREVIEQGEPSGVAAAA